MARIYLFLLTLLCSPMAFSAGFLEREVSFSEAQVQAALDKNGLIEKRYGGVLTVALQEIPRITLGTPAGQATLSVRSEMTLVGQRPLPVDVQATAGIRYDDQSKSFFLENPVVQSVVSRDLPKEAEPAVRRGLTTLLVNYLQRKPVYVLREDGSAEEKAARWLLKSVRIETGKVIATLSPF